MQGTALMFLVKQVRDSYGKRKWQQYTVEAMKPSLEEVDAFIGEKPEREHHWYEVERAHFIKLGEDWHRVYVSKLKVTPELDAQLSAAVSEVVVP